MSTNTKQNIKSSTRIQNWMKTVETVPAVSVNVSSVEEIQRIVKDPIGFPSPVRPAGNVLSPSAIHLNNAGTTLFFRENMSSIHGLVEISCPAKAEESENHTKNLTCIDCDPGCTLRELQLYAHQNNLELPFSAEIGLSTIGGTVFATTKDSAVGHNPADNSGGIGDVGSMLYKVWVVEEDGEVHDYCPFTEDGKAQDSHFQELLDSYGSLGIACRMWIMTRPKTPLTTTLRVWPLKMKKFEELAQRLRYLRTKASQEGGNIFASIAWKSKLCILEERIPKSSSNRRIVLPHSVLLRPTMVTLKKYLIQRGMIPAVFHLLRPVSGTPLLRYYESSRAPGNHYSKDVPKHKKKLSFSYYSFDERNLEQVVLDGLNFTHLYQKEHKFAPVGFAIYFVTHSGKRVAGPYSNSSSDRTVSFSFDPIHNEPNDTKWRDFCTAFNTFAKNHGGRPSLNQTLELESDLEYGGTAVAGTPSPRFTSEWLQQFYDNKKVEE